MSCKMGQLLELNTSMLYTTSICMLFTLLIEAVYCFVVVVFNKNIIEN